MANESERPIEKLLRAYAKKRRAEAGAGPGLHPANRRQLQDEVARRFGGGQPRESFWSRWRAEWPKLAWGVGAVAVAIVAAVLWWPAATQPQSELLLARNEPAAQKAPAPAAAPGAAASPRAKAKLAPSEPAANGAGLLAKSESAPSLGVESQATDKDRSRPAGELKTRDRSALNAPAPSESLDAESKPGIVSSGAVVAAAPSAPQPMEEKLNQSVVTGEQQGASAPANLASKASGSAPMNLSAGRLVTQHFARTISVAPKNTARLDALAAPPLLLRSFTFEQSGRELRVVDSDGSVYTGYLEVADVTKRLRSADATDAPQGGLQQAPLRSLRAAAAPGVQQGSQAYFFRVSGTNQTLKQPVVFSGELLPATNQVTAAQSAGQRAVGSGSPALRFESDRPVQVPARISGTAIVGDHNETKIEATAAAR